ncbi:YuzF family protein [Ammoniphilus sp. CFH 90114]|uniref:YuzF family protein n=1 Tax=Ammoniphilus sp. CFH 90114 TaxID=2493665 RepID=UPI00100DF84A|nr:YuzF family protein [Ammoniphilus sp. CFH 90114]RXT06376.1 DUF2642 domain-containing protein [Ammoniphilus sp. CFH 90114]
MQGYYPVQHSASTPSATPITTYTLVDPYVYQTLKTVVGKMVIVETVRGSIRGTLQKVVPDHIVLQAGDSTFFVRIQQIIWVMPD